MARIRSFQINYKKQSFPLLIGVIHEEQKIIYTVHFVERKLGFLQPGDKIIYCKQLGLREPNNLPVELRDELSRCIHENEVVVMGDAFLQPSRA